MGRVSEWVRVNEKKVREAISFFLFGNGGVSEIFRLWHFIITHRHRVVNHRSNNDDDDNDADDDI